MNERDHAELLALLRDILQNTEEGELTEEVKARIRERIARMEAK